jgi:cellulose synthase operon protein C
LFVAAHFDRVEVIPQLVSRFETLVKSQVGSETTTAIETLAGQCFRGLRKLGMREEIERMLTLMSAVVLQDRPLASLEGRADRPAALRALLHVAGGWFYFGWDSRAEPVLKAARAALFGDGWTNKVLEHTNLACVYAATLGQAPVDLAQRRLEEIFDKLSGIRDTFTTNDYYSQSQFKVVEAVVLAVVSDDFTLGAQARRWLDDDEFLVRRRIHHDCREMMKK